jgi:hypothetical protein
MTGTTLSKDYHLVLESPVFRQVRNTSLVTLLSAFRLFLPDWHAASTTVPIPLGWLSDFFKHGGKSLSMHYQNLPLAIDTQLWSAYG